MSTSVVCERCATLQESAAGAPPKGWRQVQDGYLCPRCCAIAGEDGVGAADADVLDEEVIYPSVDVAVDDIGDTIDEFYCEVCNGPCQGH